MSAIYEKAFEAARAAVRHADPETSDGFALGAYFMGHPSVIEPEGTIIVSARAGGIEHRWAVEYSAGAWKSVKDMGSKVLMIFS